MSENSGVTEQEIRPRAISRRTFLKSLVGLGAAAAAATVFPQIPKTEPAASALREQTAEGDKPKERIFQGELSFIAIKGLGRPSTKDKDNYERKRSIHAVEQITEALRNHPAELVITPELSFQVPGAPLILTKVEGGYEVNPSTDPFQRETVEKLRALARTNKSDIFAATFNERVEGQKSENNTLLHINDEGVIVGIKRKALPPEGSFIIQRGNNKYNVLPVICGEMWLDAELDEEKTLAHPTGGNVYTKVIPEWVKQGAPYDVLIHPENQADVDFGEFATIAHNGPSLPSITAEKEEWLRDAFDNYYSSYLPYLVEEAPIVVSDIGISAVFNSALKPLPSYIDGQGYTFGSK